ncbi:hypothetical protein Nit79A3_1357 [Nitrosomonas sp. Is79A3]
MPPFDHWRYTQTCADGTEVPVIFDSQELIPKTAHHLHPCDYMAATAYTRSAFEKLIRKHCEDRSKKLVFKSQIGKIMLTIQLRFTLTNPMPPRINRIKGKQKQRGETV